MAINPHAVEAWKTTKSGLKGTQTLTKFLGVPESIQGWILLDLVVVDSETNELSLINVVRAHYSVSDRVCSL